VVGLIPETTISAKRVGKVNMPAPDMPLPKWRKSSFSQNGDCVEVNFSREEVLVRDSKHPDQGILAFSPSEWSTFIASIQAGWFDWP
jgi:hypothetical protein